MTDIETLRALLGRCRLKLVPIDPTPEMLAAAWRTFRFVEGGTYGFGPGPGFKEAFQAMIAAAPLWPATVLGKAGDEIEGEG